MISREYDGGIEKYQVGEDGAAVTAMPVACMCQRWGIHRLSRGVLGDSLGALGDGVLGELTGEQQTHRGLDLAGGESLALVVTSKLATLGGDALLDVVDEGVHHRHATLGDAGVRVDLLQHLVDVRVVGLHALLLASSGLGSLLGALGGSLGGDLLGG